MQRYIYTYIIYIYMYNPKNMQEPYLLPKPRNDGLASSAPSHHTSCPPVRLYAKTPQHSTQVSRVSLVTIDTFLSTAGGFPPKFSAAKTQEPPGITDLGPSSLLIWPQKWGISILGMFMMTFLGGSLVHQVIWFHQSRWRYASFQNLPTWNITITITKWNKHLYTGTMTQHSPSRLVGIQFLGS